MTILRLFCLALTATIAVLVGAPWWAIVIGALLVAIVWLLAFISDAFTWPGWS